jgi:tetratricopeptide (TPR) repeat protein
MKNKKKNLKAKKSPVEKKSREDSLSFINDELMLFFTLILAGIYFLYSQVSDGMYQHDEAGHFISMRSFWYNPNDILGNWAKVGYKLIYVIPSLLGEGFVIAVNCVVAALTSFFSYKVVKQLNGKFAVLAFILLASQPMWFQLSFRNYSEIITAFLLVLALYMFFKNKLIWSAFIVSYICLIRQEFYLILVIFGIYLLFNKQFRAILIAAICPVLYNVWGFIATGDPFYLISQVLGTSSRYGDAYPRQGIGHYPLVSEVIFGIAILTLVIIYIGSKALNWKRINWFILIPAVLFFCIHCIFNSKTLEIGPASGGNLRYMAVIGPLLAIIGALALDEVKNVKKRYRLLIFLIPLLFVAGYFWSYEFEGIHLGDERNWRPLIVGGICSIFIFLPVKNNAIITLVFVLLSTTSAIKSIEPIPNSPENETMKDVTKWYAMQIRRSQSDNSVQHFKIDENTQIYAQHLLFMYYQGKTVYDFNKTIKPVMHNHVDTAGIGSLIIWDSHYSYRPKLREESIPDQYFIDRPIQYHLLNTFQSTDNKFNVKVFLKMKQADQNFEEGMAKFESKEYTDALHYFNASISANPENYIAWFFAGACYQNQRNLNNALACYNKSIDISNTYPNTLLNRGILLSMANQNSMALNDFNNYISLKPGDPNGFMRRGNLYFNQNEFENAIKDYAQAVKLAPRYAEAYYNVGLAQVELQQRQNACKNFEKAKELGSKQAENAIKQFCN